MISKCQNSLYEGFFLQIPWQEIAQEWPKASTLKTIYFWEVLSIIEKKSITIDFTNQQLLQCPALVEMKHLSPALLKVLHYGPTDGSKTGNEEVLSFIHGLPDQSWPDPDPSDPLSVVDQVSPPLILGWCNKKCRNLIPNFDLFSTILFSFVKIGPNLKSNL